MLKIVVIAFSVLRIGQSFECFTCNTELSDNGPCIDRKTVCESSTSCSMAVMYYSGRSIVRKFCTPPNTPMYQYLMMMPGASMCQNVDLTELSHPVRQTRHAGPPATPGDHASLLCVCTTPLCNKGVYSKVLENTMLNNLPRRLLPPVQQYFEKEPRSEQLDDSIAQQMADAGF
uniref:UPAR/Ly6 domain-containing protein n=1 Tax=Caenorhabditis tropicalis TaxID=1561998 RepID=A0A1I7T619_9PELO